MHSRSNIELGDDVDI